MAIVPRFRGRFDIIIIARDRSSFRRDRRPFLLKCSGLCFNRSSKGFCPPGQHDRTVAAILFARAPALPTNASPSACSRSSLTSLDPIPITWLTRTAIGCRKEGAGASCPPNARAGALGGKCRRQTSEIWIQLVVESRLQALHGGALVPVDGGASNCANGEGKLLPSIATLDDLRCSVTWSISQPASILFTARTALRHDSPTNG